MGLPGRLRLAAAPAARARRHRRPQILDALAEDTGCPPFACISTAKARCHGDGQAHHAELRPTSSPARSSGGACRVGGGAHARDGSLPDDLTRTTLRSRRHNPPPRCSSPVLVRAQAACRQRCGARPRQSSYARRPPATSRWPRASACPRRWCARGAPARPPAPPCEAVSECKVARLRSSRRPARPMLTSRRCATATAGCTTAYIDSALNAGKLHLRCPGAAGSGLAVSST